MTTDEEVDAFLEHFGRLGMKWGQRSHKIDRIDRVAAGTSKRQERVSARKVSKAASKEEWGNRSKGQKATIRSAAVIAGVAGYAFVGSRTLNVPLAAGAGAASALGAAHVTKKLLDRGKTPVSMLSN